ncbi:MAG: fibronectin type III domain-containing protein, partial [Fervidobacterium sp.]|nr:fibronectin type III domain-containing protein [Fervidobacterium sp.]
MKRRYYLLVTVLVFSLFLFTNCAQLFNQPPDQLSNESLVAKDGATNLDIEGITLKWKAVDPEGQSLKYDLYVGEGTNPSSWIIQEKDLTKEEFTLSNLKPNTTYSWKFVAKDPQGASKESALYRFTTGKNLYSFMTVEYRSGGPEENVDVSFYKMDGTLIKTKKTGPDGIVKLASDENEIKVVAKKYG